MTPAAPTLDAAIARALSVPSRFYRDRLGGDASPARLPLTRRAELLRDQLAHLPLGTRRLADAGPPVRVGISGTGDDLLVLAWSAKELAHERAAGVRLLASLGVTAGMRVANTLAGALVTPGALLFGDVVEDLGALDVPLGAIDGEPAARQAWELVDRVRPDVLVLEEASAARLFAAAPAGGRRWWHGIVWLRRGAAVSAERAAPPAGFEGWQRVWLAVPEATSFVAASCAAGRLHVDEGVHAEVVDESTGAAVAAGTTGALALTVVGGDAPLLRYATGLAARFLPAPCACGAARATLELC